MNATGFLQKLNREILNAAGKLDAKKKKEAVKLAEKIVEEYYSEDLDSQKVGSEIDSLSKKYDLSEKEVAQAVFFEISRKAVFELRKADIRIDVGKLEESVRGSRAYALLGFSRFPRTLERELKESREKFSVALELAEVFGLSGDEEEFARTEIEDIDRKLEILERVLQIHEKIDEKTSPEVRKEISGLLTSAKKSPLQKSKEAPGLSPGDAAYVKSHEFSDGEKNKLDSLIEERKKQIGEQTIEEIDSLFDELDSMAVPPGKSRNRLKEISHLDLAES